MRRLGQPEVLRSAGIAALATTVLCYPRLSLWSGRLLPLWYLEAVLFCGGIVLWAFVFAWHTEYTGHPVFTLNIKPRLFTLTTLAGIGVAIVLHRFLDPSLKLRTPEDYPDNFDQWAAQTLFHLAFIQLFLILAPLAWLSRLIKSQTLAITLTVLFGVLVLVLKTHSSQTPPPPGLFVALLTVRIVFGFFSVLFYLRGGILLVSWCGFLIQARHLFDLSGS
jgi:FtsH-binding integral membrane protein